MNKLSIISLLLLSFFVSFSSLAAEWGVVVVPKAIIYADIEMKASIGYIKKGKKIRVGEKARNSGQVVPIIVSKRVAYIKLSDIETSAKKSVIEGITSRSTKKNHLTDQKNLIGLGLSSSLTTVNFPQAATADNQYNLILFGVAVRIHKLGKSARYGWRGTLGFRTGERERETFKILNLDIDYYYKLFRSSFFDLNISAGLALVPFAEYGLGEDFALNGYGGGFQLDVEGILKFEKFAIHIASFYQYQQLLGFKLPENEMFPEDLNPSLASLGVTSFVSFYY